MRSTFGESSLLCAAPSFGGVGKATLRLAGTIFFGLFLSTFGLNELSNSEARAC